MGKRLAKADGSMTIGMSVNNLSVSGGYQKLVIRLSQQLEQMGHDVTIYTPDVDKKACYPNDIKSLRIVALDKKLSKRGPLETFTALSSLVDSSLDVFIIHDELSLILVGLLESPPKKVLWMLNNQLPRNLGKYIDEVKSVYTQTVGPREVKVSEGKKAYRRIQLMRRGLRRVTDFMTYDEYNKMLVRKVLHRRAINVAAGADLEAFRPQQQREANPKENTLDVLSVGVIFPHRRYQDLLRAVAATKSKGKKINATIVGRQDFSKEYFEELVALRSRLKLEHDVQFIDYVTDTEMKRLYGKADAFVFINDGFTWGISVFEAIAARIPVLITSNIGAADLVQNGRSGFVVSPKDPTAISEAFLKMMNDPSQAKRLADKAYDKILPYVSWEAYTKRVLNIIEQ